MFFSFDSSDATAHINQLKLPAGVKFQGIVFEPPHAFWVDGAFDAGILGGYDVKVKFQFKLIDSRTIRARLIEVKVSGFGVGDVKNLVYNVVEKLNLPGVVVKQGKVPHSEVIDRYVEYTVPVDFVPIKALETDEDSINVVIEKVDINKAIAYIAAAEKSKMGASGSMADKANLVVREGQGNRASNIR